MTIVSDAMALAVRLSKLIRAAQHGLVNGHGDRQSMLHIFDKTKSILEARLGVISHHAFSLTCQT